MAKTALAAATALGMLFAGCSSAESGEAVDPPTAAAAEPAPAEPVDAQFCADGNAFVTDTKARLIATPNAATFADIDVQLGALAGRSPDELSDSVAALRGGYAAIGEAYAATGYEPGATLTLSPDIQDANTTAASTLRGYLLANCDLESTRDAQIAQIVDAFGIEDAATAECVHAQLGDVANIDSATLSPELMTAPICGTSILGLLSGQSTSDP